MPYPTQESADKWKCGARQQHIGPEVQDCNWPFCGCDPYAGKVLDAIAESGCKIVQDDSKGTWTYESIEPTLDLLARLEWCRDSRPLVFALRKNDAFTVGNLRATITALRELHEAAEPFIRHYSLWMNEWPDEKNTSTYPVHTFGELRRLVGAVHTARKAASPQSGQTCGVAQQARGSSEVCPTCGRSDVEHSLRISFTSSGHHTLCSDPWHGDDHLRKASSVPSGQMSEPIAFINIRLQDLAEANAIYGKDQRLDAPSKVARNEREISWLKDLRSMIASPARSPGDTEAEIADLRAAKEEYFQINMRLTNENTELRQQVEQLAGR